MEHMGTFWIFRFFDPPTPHSVFSPKIQKLHWVSFENNPRDPHGPPLPPFIEFRPKKHQNLFIDILIQLIGFSKMNIPLTTIYIGLHDNYSIDSILTF